jgi:hypothetical protein
MKSKLIIIAVAVCIVATPAKASMFDFHFESLSSTWYGIDTFTMSVNPTLTSGSVTRLQTPQSVANFLDGQWGLGGDFSLYMTLTNITGTSALGSGSFAIWDTTGDTISGDLSGSWSRVGGSNVFSGALTGVSFANNSSDGYFDGHLGSASMSFPQPIPWHGSIIQLSTTSNWFNLGDVFTTDSGSIDASVVPLPAAVVLGVLGLGVAGLKLRKFA